MTKAVYGPIFDELYKEVQCKIAPNGIWESRKWKAFKDLRKRIEEIDLSPHETLDEKLYALRHNDRTRPVCEVCGGKVRLKCQITGYRRTCSVKCAANDSLTKKKTATTLNEKYGGHHMKNPNFIEGFVKHMKETGAYEKGMKTFEEHYGVKNRYQLESVKTAIQETCIERYGVKNPQQNEEIKATTAATIIERYGAFFNPAQMKKTMIARYGVENPMSVPEICARSIQTRVKLYGNVCNLVQVKKSNLEKYGVECVLSSPRIRYQIAETNIARYGFPNPMQNPEIRKKAVHSSPRTKQFTLPSSAVIDLQGYEPQVLNYIFSNNLFTEEELIFPVPSIKRPEGGHYTPDFWIPLRNLLIEVKSTYTWFHEKHAALARKKAQAAKDAGYSIEVWIWDDKLKQPTIVTDFSK